MDNVLPAAEDLLTFVTVADAGGFTAASRRTGIPKSRLSRRVAALEAFLGVALVRRDARRFVLTELGERIYAHGQAAHAQTQAAVALARDSAQMPQGVLRVACPATMAAVFLVPIAQRFSATYPRVSLTVQTTNGNLGPLDDMADILIQPATQPLSNSSLVGRELATVPYALYTSPVLAQRLGPLTCPETLAQAPAVGWRFHTHPHRWTLLGPQGAPCTVNVNVRFESDSLQLNCDAAVNGLGVAQLPQALAKPHVQAQRLVRVLPDWQPPNMHVHALYPSRRHLTPAGRCFLDMLVQDFAADLPA